MPRKARASTVQGTVGQSQFRRFWRQFRKNKGAVVGLAMFAVVLFLAVVAPLLWDYDTDIVGMNASIRLLPCSWEHPFGTDSMGRDVFARVCYGARYSLFIGLLSVGISCVIGIPLGALAAYYGGKADLILMRIIDLLIMVPAIILAIVLVALTGISMRNLILAMGITTIPHFARNARAAVLTVTGNEYVESARAIGERDWHIIFSHVLPNAFSPILVQATTRLASVILSAAGFSFIGLGVPPPTPEWGAMLAESRTLMRAYPNLVLAPGLAIFFTILAINLVGDGLRDAFDPKLKR